MQIMPYGVGHRDSKTHIREFCHSGCVCRSHGKHCREEGQALHLQHVPSPVPY